MIHPFLNRLAILCLAFFLIVSCDKEDPDFAPNFHSIEVGTVATGTTINIHVLVNGSPAQIKEAFYVYDTKPGLTVNTTAKVPLDHFSSHIGFITGLTVNTTYYVKVFIISKDFGTIESEEFVAKTLSPSFNNFPTEGERGAEVSIGLTNGSSSVSDYLVKFGETPATVTQAMDVGIKVIVPPALPRGPMKISVTVKDVTTISTTNFTAFNIPMITSITPIQAMGGALVVVKGKDFNISTTNGVKIGSNFITITKLTNTDPDNASFEFTAPESLPAGQYDIAVGSGTSFKAFAEKFTLLPSPWVKKADFAGGAREGAIAFTIGSKAYVGMGVGASRLIDLWEYDMAADAWTRKADFPGDAREGAVAFSIGGKGYVGCGSKEIFTTLKDFWEYNPATNAWTRLADFGGTARSAAVGVSANGKGYIGLGRDAGGLKKDWWEYDVALNTWTQRADFTGIPRESANAFAIGTQVYAGMGNSNSLAALADFYQYDPATNTWTKKSDFGGGVRSMAMAFVINNIAYVGGGFNQSINAQSDFWKYDPSANQWTSIRKIDTARDRAVGFSLSGAGFVVTGVSATQVKLAEVWRFNP